jgi:hypothetical protein
MPDQVAANNKAVVFRGRAERERARLPRAVRGNGLVSSKALRRFQKRAGHNPPKPAAATSAVELDPPPGPFAGGGYDDTPTAEQRERERGTRGDYLDLKLRQQEIESGTQGVTRGSQLYVKTPRPLPRMR